MGGAGGGWGRGRCLGRGSTATVFLANSSAAEQRTFAVKSAELCRSAPLQREQKVLSSLGHPHIVSYLGSDVTAEADGRVFYNLFMEYVPGGSLAEEIQNQGRLDERAIRVYTRAILGALMYIHHRGIVHCDVKGHNILLSKDAATAKLADFGCARWLGESDGRVVAGTPLYMAPEAARGEEQGTAADIWALGCTVVEMASGGPAWRGISDPVAALHRIAFSDDVPELPCDAISGEGQDFLTRCLNRDPAKRWSAEELLNHPFVSRAQESIAGGGLARNSPVSVLDRDFWDSWQEDDEADKSDNLVDAQSPAFAHGCLRRLLGGVSPPPLPPPASTTWEDSSWVTVRNSEDLRCRVLQDETPAGSSGLAESSGDGVGSTVELAAHDDGNHVAATVSHPPPSSTYLSVAASVIVSISSAPTEEAMANYSVDPRDFLLVSRKPRSCPAIMTTGVVTMMLEFYNKHWCALPCSIALLFLLISSGKFARSCQNGESKMAACRRVANLAEILIFKTPNNS